MPQVALSLLDGGRSVDLRLGDDVRGEARVELESALLLIGALPDQDGYLVDAPSFRRGAVELARLLRRLDAVVELDEGVEALLRTQLKEIGARRSAEDQSKVLSEAEVLEGISASGRFNRELTKEQIENLGRLLSLPHGANFSVPGAGKTSTLLAVYEALRGHHEVDRLLVIAPKNAFGSWEHEVAESYKASTRPRVLRLEGGLSGVERGLLEDPEIALITYQLLPNVLEKVKTWGRVHDLHAVLDESHRVKAGYAGVTAAAALELGEVAVRRDILSGTPLPHSPEDLRPQLDFLWPGQRILPDFRVVADAPSDQISVVERAVRPLYVRTTKDDLQLPELDGPVPVSVELGPLQRELYDVLRSEAARVASGMRQRDIRFFRQLGRQVVQLLQAAVNPMLLTQGELVAREEIEPLPEGGRAWDLLREIAKFEQPAKIEKAVQRARDVMRSDRKVLIWTGFIMNILSLEELLADEGAVVLYGAVPTGSADDPETREGRIRRFHEDPTCQVMVANPAAAGEGISLHQACHHAIYLDRSFNAAHYLQSVDRIHRLGLDAGTVTRVEVLEAQDTIDQRVAHRLARKIEAMSKILNDPGLAALAYDPADVVEDFGGGIEPDDIDEILDHLESDPED